jgi:hypothetical protein
LSDENREEDDVHEAASALSLELAEVV